MSDDNYYGYVPEEYPDTLLKVYGMEKYEAQVMLGIYERQYPDGVMHLLEMAWERGHHAASELNVPVWDNPFVHPDKAIEKFDKNREKE
jgi:hypothetical protein